MLNYGIKRRGIPLAALLVVILACGLPMAASAAAPVPAGGGDGLQVLRSDGAGVTFELTAGDLALDDQTVAVQGADGCRQVRLPGSANSAEAGLPALPARPVLIGVPQDARPQVSVEVLASSSTAAGKICPAVTRAPEPVDAPIGVGTVGSTPAVSTPALDLAVYAANAFYPASNARLVDLGSMRGQRLLRVEAFPAQYNPVTGELRLAERMRVTVTFGAGAGPAVNTAALATASAAAPAPDFENAFRISLLNYDQAKAWRVQDLPLQDRFAAAEAATAAWKPPVPGFKVTVKQAGIYQMTYRQLQDAGVPVASLDPRTLKMYVQGREIRIRVTGEGDGRLDNGDLVVFYGEGVNTRYTDTNVYWLTYGGAPGLRMVDKPSQAGGSQPGSFTASTHFEENLAYVSSLPKLPGYDHWYGKLWTATGASKAFSENLAVTNLATPPAGTTASLQVRLAGNLDRRHHLRLYVNGVQLLDDSTNWVGRTVFTATATFPHTQLVAGANQVKVELVNDVPGFVFDQAYADWLQLGYEQSLDALGGVLAFGSPTAGAAGPVQYTVKGFSAEGIEAYDVTDAFNPAPIAGGTVTGGAGGPYSLTFGATSPGEGRFIALTPDKRRGPEGIAADTPSDLQANGAGAGADTIIITHGDFRAAVQALADLRISQGQRVRVVDVQDAYDEFGYGLMSAEAIRGFIAYAYANLPRPAPSTIVLVGDGTYDMRHYLASSGPTFLPPFLAMVDREVGETAADNRFVTVDGPDALPDLNVGRLPANTAAEATTMVDKALQYEKVAPAEPWTSRVLLVSDDLEDGGGDFYALSDDIANGYSPYKGRNVKTLPKPYQADKIYLGQTCDTSNPTASTECRQQLVNTLNSQGALFVSYIGHGTKTYWAKERIFDAAAVSQLQTANHLPIMLPMTCDEGYFQDAAAGAESLSEAGLRMPGSGSAASWSATGFGLSSGHDYLERGLFVNLFYGRIAELGAATTAAKLYLAAYAPPGAYIDLIETFLLLGDPGLHVPLQAPPESKLYLPLLKR